MEFKVIVGKKQIQLNFGIVFFMICFLLNSGYAYNLVSDIPTLISLFICSVVILVLFGFKKGIMFKYSFWSNPYIVLCVFITLSMIINADFNSWGSYFRQISILVLAVLFCKGTKVEKFTKIFLNFMVFVTTISITMWVVINIFNIRPPLPIMTINSDVSYYKDYYNGGLFFINTYSTARLMGPFWEPGIYASMTILALLLQEIVKLNLSIRRKKINTIILVIGIILSFSTAGYMLLLILFVIKTLTKVNGKNATIIILLLIVVLLVMLIYSDEILNLLNNWLPNVFGKLTFESNSKLTRINGPLIDLKIFMNNPIFGAGMTDYQLQWPHYAGLMNVESRTSTITYFLANYGIPGILYLFAILRGVFRQKNFSLVIRMCILVIIVSILSKEPHYINLLTNIIITYLNVKILDVLDGGER